MIKYFVKENTWLTRSYGMDFGWGNGYVAIPKGNFLHGKHYDEINEHIDAHHGLTMSCDASEIDNWGELHLQGIKKTDWVIGFDTCHHRDTLESWPQERVLGHSRSIATQVEIITDIKKLFRLIPCVLLGVLTLVCLTIIHHVL